LIPGDIGDCAPGLDSVAEWARDTVSAIAALIGARDLGHITLIMMRAATTLPPHTDGMGGGKCARCQAVGASQCLYFARFPNRFHCVITSNSDCWFEAGGETVCMRPGELWWFNQKVEHGVRNAGNTDRIHLLFDAGP
jgi:hypothetical protein